MQQLPPIVRTAERTRCYFLGNNESFDFEVHSHRIVQALVGTVENERDVSAYLKREYPTLARQLPRHFDLRHFYQPYACSCFFCERDVRAQLERRADQLVDWKRVRCYQCDERPLNPDAQRGNPRDVRAAMLCSTCLAAAAERGVCRWCASVVAEKDPRMPSLLAPVCTGRRDWRRDDSEQTTPIQPKL